VGASLEILPGVRLDANEIRFTYAHSGGPGGQNVNKVETKAVLRLQITKSPSFNEAQRARLTEQLANRLTRDGELVLHASRHRQRERNKEDAIERLVAILRGALEVQKKRRPTRPTRGSKRRRLDSKRKNAEKKRLRRDP
jgi:ribosome-associated protein